MILEKLQDHLENKKYARITRLIEDDHELITHGFILCYNKDLVLLHEVGDFAVLGYIVFPTEHIKKIRHNKFDKCVQKILKGEGEFEKININYAIDISSWQTTFDNVRKMGLNVIVECERKDIDTFTIGPIIKTTAKKVHIQNFDATGLLEEELVKIDIADITKLQFDNRYVNVFSKYLRQPKPKKEATNE